MKDMSEEKLNTDIGKIKMEVGSQEDEDMESVKSIPIKQEHTENLVIAEEIF